MIYSNQEIESFIKDSLGVCEAVTITPLKATGNMTARLEDGGEVTLLNVLAGEKEYALKIKSTAFENNVGDAMNYYASKDFEESFLKGKYVFYIRSNYNRESKVYSALSQVKEYLPKVYGAQNDSYRSLILLEKLDISREPKDIELADFLRKLHSLYIDEKEVEKLGANVHTKEDYTRATALSLKLLDSIERVYPDFPKEILTLAGNVINNYAKVFDKMISYPRCLCHGDCTINNMTTTPSLKLYDLELSTYNNAEFDLVSYLVHYPTLLNKGVIVKFLSRYYDDDNFMANKKEVLSLNLLIYFVTRFHAMMMIAKKLDMPYMETSIKNYIYLFRFFNL